MIAYRTVISVPTPTPVMSVRRSIPAANHNALNVLIRSHAMNAFNSILSKPKQVSVLLLHPVIRKDVESVLIMFAKNATLAISMISTLEPAKHALIIARPVPLLVVATPVIRDSISLPRGNAKPVRIIVISALVVVNAPSVMSASLIMIKAHALNAYLIVIIVLEHKHVKSVQQATILPRIISVLPVMIPAKLARVRVLIVLHALRATNKLIICA